MSLKPRDMKLAYKKPTKKEKRAEYRKEERLKEIREKKSRGESLTPEEIMFLKRNRDNFMCEGILRKMNAAERALFELKDGDMI